MLRLCRCILPPSELAGGCGDFGFRPKSLGGDRMDISKWTTGDVLENEESVWQYLHKKPRSEWNSSERGAYFVIEQARLQRIPWYKDIGWWITWVGGIIPTVFITIYLMQGLLA
jgi:hypothetical protein